MSKDYNPIEQPKELVETIEATLRKDIAGIIALYEHGVVPENVSEKLVKTRKFLLALTLKLDEELRKREVYGDK